MFAHASIPDDSPRPISFSETKLTAVRLPKVNDNANSHNYYISLFEFSILIKDAEIQVRWTVLKQLRWNIK